MADVQKLLGEYLDYLEIEKNRSPKTRENYERYLKDFLRSTNIKTPQQITEDVVRKYRIDLNRRLVSPKHSGEGGTMKKVTQNYYLIALRNFLKYLSRRDIKSLAPEKIELPKIPERQIDIIEYRDLERLLAAPKETDIKTVRDKAILETLFSTGLRLAELCSLNCDIDLERGEFTIRGKGNKLRVVFLSEGARNTLKQYLKMRGDMEEAMFISFAKGKISAGGGSSSGGKVTGRIQPRAVERLVDFWARKAGIAKRLHPHQLRHLFATDLLINGADLRSVQSLLGHANITTTQTYTHLTNKELKEIHSAFHGKRRK
ncbi:MAG: tyrosine-type recombinase/integrase [Patescibacteria group bacterium]